MNTKEQDFIADYKALLKKQGVSLVVETSSDEYGRYAVPIFKQLGKYCTINYEPEYTEINDGYHGMGG
jgi:hypothetical protein